MSNKSLKVANKNKNDEFYTQYEDIENELKHYTKYFKNKIIYCNCDDYDKSAFVQYFLDHFEEFGLKKLVASCHIKDDKGKVLEYTTNNEKKYILEGNGDFRSDECIELLKEADIIITNPPFSLFREYIDQIIKYKKKFLILGNQNAITYKEFFPLLKNNKVWTGYTTNKTMEFIVPENAQLNKAYYDSDGKRKVKVPSISWYTNLDNLKRHEKLQLYKTYTPDKYPKYDNYDVINVNRTAEIPIDYFGVMGVPITFMNKYNPDQFEIVGIACGHSWTNYTELLKSLNFNPSINPGGGLGTGIVNGKAVYARLLIKHKLNL